MHMFVNKGFSGMICLKRIPNMIFTEWLDAINQIQYQPWNIYTYIFKKFNLYYSIIILLE